MVFGWLGLINVCLDRDIMSMMKGAGGVRSSLSLDHVRCTEAEMRSWRCPMLVVWMFLYHHGKFQTIPKLVWAL